MPRPRSGSPWQLILPCLALLLAACGGPPRPELVAIPHPSLDRVDEEAGAQLDEARARLATLEAAGSPGAEMVDATAQLGRLYHGYGFDEAALAAYSNAVVLAPEDSRWLYYLGSLELEAGELESGEEHLERALRLTPGDGPTLRRLGQAALDRADFDRAAALYSRAAETEPDCAAAHFGIGLAALGSSDHDRAVMAFEQTLDLEPSASQTHRPLAMAYRALGQRERAREQLALAGTAVPTCPDPLMAEIQRLARGASALFERAALADLEGRSKAALALAHQAVEADPDHAAARRLYGQLLTRNGRVDAAIEQLEAAARLEPQDRRTYMLLGRAHRAGGELDASVEALTHAVELDPQYSRAKIELALSQIERGRWSEARSNLEQGLASDPGNLDLRVQLARTLAAMGDTEQSRRELEAVVAQSPRLSVAHLALGILLLEAERATDAEGHLEMAIEGDGTAEIYALAHYQLARVARGRHDDARASRHLETAIALSPTLVEAKLALGELELAQGRSAQATRLFAEAAAMRPDLPQPRAAEALALLHSGRHLDASRKLEQANMEFPRDPEIAHLLARVLATAPAPRVRDGQRALQLASGLFGSRKSIAYGETVAMALAELDRFAEAAEWQQRLLEQARGSGAGVVVLEQLEARLADYERGRPARAAW